MFPHMPGPMIQTIQNVSDTAFMVAGFRAAESERSLGLRSYFHLSKEVSFLV
jgi:hypothetical protein